MTVRPIRNFTGLRPVWERMLYGLTRNRWPARLADALGLDASVTLSAHTIAIPRPLGAASRLRIAFAADFHAGPTTSDRTLDAAVRRLQEAAADLVLIGGDFVSSGPEYAAPLAERLRALHPPLGCYAVLGNHDYWAGPGAVIRDLETAHIQMLTNAAAHLPPPYDQVSIVGLDDHLAGHPDADAAFAEARPVRLLLMHQPSGLLDAGEHAWSLALSGHTHGGQIAAPWGWRPTAGSGKLSRTYPAGCYTLGSDRVLLVSRGVGCTNLPFRINAPAEVHQIDLIST